MTVADKVTILDSLTRARTDLMEIIEPFGVTEWATIVYSEEQTWTIADILRHLTSAEASMTRLVELIRDGGEGVPTNFDLQRWNARGIEKASEKGPAELTREMTANRIHLFEVVDQLSDDDFEKSGRHGSMRIMTIEEILNLIADHEKRHTQDIQEAVKKTGD